MTNEMIGIISVFVFTGILLLLRRLILTGDKRRGNPSLAREAREATRGSRSVDSRDEKKSAGSQANRVRRPNQPGAFPRFPI